MASQRDIVLLSLPFSDFTTVKKRPAIILSNDRYNKTSQDIIAVAITSNLKINELHIPIKNEDLERGTLIKHSKIKTDKIFTVEKKFIEKYIGRINENTFEKLKVNVSKILE